MWVWVWVRAWPTLLSASCFGTSSAPLACLEVELGSSERVEVVGLGERVVVLGLRLRSG